MAQVSTSAAVEVPGATVDEVFDYATDLQAPAEFFAGYGPIPAIRRIEMLDGATPAVGARRRVVLADQSELVEEILVLDRPRHHAYRVTGYRAPFSLLTHEGEGEWYFEPRAQGVRVTWNYRYTLTSPLVWPVGVAMMSGLMRPAMQRALERIAARNWAGGQE